VLLGYFFGNIPFIRQYLNIIVLVGIGAAIVPVAIGGVWKMMRKSARDEGVGRPNGNR
jgi:membrane-associated protein